MEKEVTGNEAVRNYLSEIGKKGGSVTSEKKAATARENGKAGGALPYDEFNVFLQPTKTNGVKKQYEQLENAINTGMALKVTKGESLRLLRLVPNSALNRYDLSVEYPPDASGQRQVVHARIQPLSDGGIPDIKFWAKKNNFEIIE
jgi:hypothetical protein